MRMGFAFAAAMLFVVQPAYVSAVAWVGAVAEALVVLFGCSSTLALLRFRRSGRLGWLVVSVVLFALATLSHESGVAFLPILVAADRVAGWRRPIRDLVQVFWPFAAVVTAYVAVTLMANADHVREELDYTLGFHVVRHTFNYIIALYVDKPTVASYAIVGAVLALVALAGNARARFAVAWMICGILPFAPFGFGVVSRYAYIPAIGLALLVAEGLAALHARFGRRSMTMAGRIVAVIAVLIALRFAYFARDGVKDMWNGAERYRTFLAELRRERPVITDGTVIYISPERHAITDRGFLEAAVQWEYQNLTLRVNVK